MDSYQKIKVKNNKELLNECMARDGATIVGEYEKLTYKTIIGFICNCGFEYKKGFETIINNSGLSCKKCSIIKGHYKRKNTIINNLNYEDSLQYLYPGIANQWHPTKNGDLNPYQVVSMSHEKVWWLCDKTCHEGCIHEWQSTIASRTGLNSGCPFCSVPSKKICVHNSLQYLYPGITNQWHPAKNGDLKPENVCPGSVLKVWWLCDKTCPEGCIHEWVSTLNDRARGNKGCPFCSIPVKKMCIHNSLQYLYPEIANQWHPAKNGDLKSNNISPGSRNKY